MDAATSKIRPERDAAHSRRLRAKIRAATRWSLALGLHLVVPGLPIAANYGKGMRTPVKPILGRAPRSAALGITAPCTDAATIALAMLSTTWDGHMPRKERR